MDARRAERLYQKAEAGRWKLPVEVLTNALERSAEKAHAGRTPSDAELDRYFDSLHLTDLALACACAMGKETAWDHFVTEFRPAMYRAADAMDPSGGAREVADALYAELFGLREKDGIRQSVFRYFHGRSSLSTWLRSVVSQRYIDRHRESKRLQPLADEGAHETTATRIEPADPERARYLASLRAVLAAAIAALAPRDRLRLACYYAQEMTLAQIGKLTREHEATVSRQLARTRRDVRSDVERRLHEERGFSKPEIDECFTSVIDDSGHLDLSEWLNASPIGGSKSVDQVGGRKKSGGDRSMSEDPS
jgi:RNA polymerase sigma-70 factor (ECF subfamily)